MATQTANIGLRKPAGTDYVNVITDINDNMDILDGVVGAVPLGETLQGQISDIESDIGTVPSGKTVQGQITDIESSIGTVPSGKTVEGQISEINTTVGSMIDDTSTANNKVWSAQKVNDLKSAINTAYKVNKTPSQGYVNPSNGNIYGSSGTAYYKYITVDVDSNYTILYFAGSNESGSGMAFYKADGTFISDSGHDATNSLQVLSVPADAKKAKLSYLVSKESVFFTYLVLNTENLFDIIKTLNTSIGTINGSVSTINTSIGNINTKIERMIEVDRTNAKTGYVNPSNGNVIDGYSGYKYVVINAFEGCTILYQNNANESVSGIAFYRADGTFISGQTGSTSEQVITVPHGTAVAKIAFRESQMSVSYAKIYENPSKMLPKAPVIVSASGDGDYTSILAALKGTSDDTPLLIRKGVYNVISEYEAYYGNDYFTNYAGYSGVSDNFAKGLWMGQGRIITGESGVTILCEYEGENTNVQEYFSVIANAGDTVLENVTIMFSNVRYAIHDDFQPEKSTIIWRNIHFHGTPNKAAPIGGGLGLDCLYFIDGCTFVNNTKDWDINYHASNNAATNNVCTLRVTNCFGSKRFGVWKNGPATTVSHCYVSNSKFLEIVKYTPSGVVAEDNITLTKWCNQEGA